MTQNRTTIINALQAIEPFDKIESEHKQDVQAWINSAEQIYRISKPDNPSKHLVSYFVLIDAARKSIMLVNHLKAGLLLPTGGHVEIDEDPALTVVREAKEELNIEADFLPLTENKPFFVTVTKTKGIGQHTDVSLWYLVHGDVETQYDYDSSEFDGYKWFTLTELVNTDLSKLDPHMHRFTQKLMTKIS